MPTDDAAFNVPGRQAPEAPLYNWVPRLGQFSLGEAAACAEGMHALAQYFARHPSSFGETSLCARIAIWLDREVAKFHSPVILDAERTPLTLSQQLVQHTYAIYIVGHDLLFRFAGEASCSDLYEICFRLVVASGDESHAPEALLELGNAALSRADRTDGDIDTEQAWQAIGCFEQLVQHPSRHIRLAALYGAAKAHIAVADADEVAAPKEWTAARAHLQTALGIEATEEKSGTTITPKDIMLLLATVTDHLRQAGLE